MNKIFCVFLFALLTLNSINSFAQTAEYSSLEVLPDGTLSGYTNVITLNWIDPNTVEVTKTQRISTGEDEVGSYEIAGLNYSEVGSEVVFTLEDDIWIIPFEQGDTPYEITQQPTVGFGCRCAGNGQCAAIIITYPSGVVHVSCSPSWCEVMCAPFVRIETPDDHKAAVLLRAQNVIY